MAGHLETILNSKLTDRKHTHTKTKHWQALEGQLFMVRKPEQSRDYSVASRLRLWEGGILEFLPFYQYLQMTMTVLKSRTLGVERHLNEKSNWQLWNPQIMKTDCVCRRCLHTCVCICVHVCLPSNISQLHNSKSDLWLPSTESILTPFSILVNGTCCSQCQKTFEFFFSHPEYIPSLLTFHTHIWFKQDHPLLIFMP